MAINNARVCFKSLKKDWGMKNLRNINIYMYYDTESIFSFSKFLIKLEKMWAIHFNAEIRNEIQGDMQIPIDNFFVPLSAKIYHDTGSNIIAPVYTV